MIASKSSETTCFTFCVLSQFFCMGSVPLIIKHMNSFHTFDFSGDTNDSSKNIKGVPNLANRSGQECKPLNQMYKIFVASV
jgi:hypothetical protein